MASSVGEQIVQAMVAALNAPLDRPCDTERNRIDAVTSAEMPRMTLYTVSDAVETSSQNFTKRTRKLRLEMMVTGAQPADALIDPLYVFAIQTLHAADFSALMRSLEETQLQWETEPSLEDATLAAIDFEVVYVTKRTDPTEVHQ